MIKQLKNVVINQYRPQSNSRKQQQDKNKYKLVFIQVGLWLTFDLGIEKKRNLMLIE
jgi:hypothetical protein